MINYNDGTTVHSTNLERTRTDVRALGTLGAVNAELLLNLNGESSASFDIRGTFVGTVVVEGSDDGTNFISIPFYNSLTETWATTATVAGAYDIPLVSSFRVIRVRCSVYTSGSITTSLNASLGNSMMYSKPIPTNASITATAAVSTGVTCTLPASGAGLYHYITRIRISKYVGVTLTAAATPTIITTTNIATTPSFDFKTLGSLGDSEVVDIDFTGNPLKSTTANTASTFVAPILTGALWKITVFYYAGA
jgi:hypothetical protein